MAELNLARDFATGLQLGSNFAAQRSREEREDQQLEFQRREQAMRELLFPLQQQRERLGIDALTTQIRGAQTQNDVESLKLMQARQEQQMEPVFAGYLAQLDNLQDADVLNGRIPSVPNGLTSDQQYKAGQATTARLQRALQNKRAQNTIQLQIADENQAQELERQGMDVRSPNGEIDRQKLFAAQQGANTARAAMLARQYGIDPQAEGWNANLLFDSRGTLTEFGKQTMDALERKAVIAGQKDIATMRSEASTEAMNARSLLQQVRQYRKQASDLRLKTSTSILSAKQKQENELQAKHYEALADALVNGEESTSAAGQATTAQATQAASSTSPYAEGQTAINPKTRQKVIYTNGNWVPAK